LLCYAFLADPAIQGNDLAITTRTRRKSLICVAGAVIVIDYRCRTNG
jgi:hypothetical protein